MLGLQYSEIIKSTIFFNSENMNIFCTKNVKKLKEYITTMIKLRTLIY